MANRVVMDSGNRTCAYCGKEFWITDEWAYHRGTRNFCSYGCMRKFDTDHKAKDGRHTNRRKDTVTFTWMGETKTIKEWAEEADLDYTKLYSRIWSGMKNPFKGTKFEGGAAE